MRVIITGVTSFIGIYTAKQLLDEGCRVIGLIRPGSKNLGRLLSSGLFDRDDSLFQIGWVDFDTLPDPEEGEEYYRKYYREVFGGLSNIADIWIHLSWDGEGSLGREDIDLQIRNVENSKKAFLMARLLGVKKFIFAGSQAEYGSGNHRTPRPVSPYGKGKMAFGRWGFEQSLLDRLTGFSHMEFIHTRLFSVYGYGDHDKSLVSSLIRAEIDGIPIELGKCSQRWNFLEVRDAARALSLLAFTEDSQTDIYDIASADSRRLKEYINAIHRVTGGRADLRFDVRPDNCEGNFDLIPANLKMQRLGFRPEISFESGIGELFEREKKDNEKS